ncbi:MAG: type VI secretion system tip protein VgrG [Deltaproteobacteria bacterium]|nr:type VI secretion system tip protein VgrG [Deltaproteobacteria bacterium]
MAHDGGGVVRNTLINVTYDFICEDGPEAAFHVVRVRLSEDVNGTYELDLDLVTEEHGADTDALLGASCQLDIARGEHVRSVYGIAAAVDYIGHSEDHLLASVRIVPAFQLLSQQGQSRIFQDMSVLEILEEILGTELGHYQRTLDKGSASRGTAPRDYCVQYRESDHDFCVRLMEEEGISYHFVHPEDGGPEVLTLTYENDDFGELVNVDGTPVIPIIIQRPETADVESIRNFDFLQTLTTTALFRRDYDFQTPLEMLEATEEEADAKGRTRRRYRHTDRRYIADDVTERNLDHLQAAQVRAKEGRGAGNVVQFVPGRVFELERHTRDELETKYLITQVIHTGECPEELLSTAGGSGDGGPRYRNSFRCIPLDVPLRPAQVTPKPRVYGAETGIVSGPAGEEIHVDEHGRINVQFHWEEEATYDDTSSCWIRVRQQWSGPGWGFQFIPRIGQEVVVEFLGGDPDRPMVVGTVYNGDNAYPYPLPDEKTRSGIKTDSVSGDGSNELRFEDMSGGEEVYIHCQKDFTIATENDKNQTTGHDETLGIGNDRTKEVGHDQRETVKNDKFITVEGNHTEQIVKDMTLSVDGNRGCTIAKNHSESIEGSFSQSVTKSKTVSVGSSYSESVDASKSVAVKGAFDTSCDDSLSMTVKLATTIQSGKDMTVKTDKNYSLAASEDVSHKSTKKMSLVAGDNLTVKTEKKANIVAADELTIKVGSAKIVMKKSGDILINGAKIDVKGSGAVTVKGSSVDNN